MKRGALSIFAVVVVLVTQSCGKRNVPLPQAKVEPTVLDSLQKDLQEHYLDLFERAPKIEYSSNELDEMRTYLAQAREYCIAEFKRRNAQYQADLKKTEDELKAKSSQLSDEQRYDLHCRIQNLRLLQSQTEVLAKHAIPVAYENKEAKLDLIQHWPAELQQIRREIASGSYNDRRWGDVKDIGFRNIASGQADDVKIGQKAIEQMKQQGMMPKEIEDSNVVEYVTDVARKVAAKSDLHIALNVTVLNSKEINAFALPGGYLFVERGLLEAAEDESQLAGVIGHEISHDVARHGHKLMIKATVAQAFFDATEIAAMVLTGGAVSVGAYYALEYGFEGLGLVMDLALLGVSRDYEMEADQLGIQYAWNSGYDPSGFIRFFDKIATEEGYVNGATWFRDHPPFYQRMVEAEREIMFLPKRDDLIRQTNAFEEMKKALESAAKPKPDQEGKNRPSLLAPEQGCAAPQTQEYESGKQIETLCGPIKIGPVK